MHSNKRNMCYDRHYEVYQIIQKVYATDFCHLKYSQVLWLSPLFSCFTNFQNWPSMSSNENSNELSDKMVETYPE